MPVFDESRLRFEFDNGIWQSIKKVDGHVDYKKLEVLNGSKAVDFLGFCSDTLVFIEVKNFKLYKRIDDNEKLMIKVGCKVKDTVAALVGGARNSTTDGAYWQSCVIHLNTGRDVKIIFWLEEDNPTNKREKAGLGIYTNSLKRKLKWLTGGNHVIVMDSSSNDFPGLTVTNLHN